MQLAQRINRLSSSPIRDILHVLERPDMISFAGGLPAADSFPALEKLSVSSATLQYGASEGDSALRERIALHLRDLGLRVDSEQIFILSGSQQGIDLVAKLFVERNTSIAIESPTYLAALQVFEFFGANFIPFHADQLGELENKAHPPRLLYVNPTFQNPSGLCYHAKQRQDLANLCNRLGTVLFEDDPYRELFYEPCERRPIVSYLKNEQWIYQSSFSKTFAPGLRLGYLVCSKSLTKYFSRLKQACDLHTNRLSQAIILEHYFTSANHTRLNELRDLYRHKRDRFNDYLKTYLGDIASWSRPQGGLFFWIALNPDIRIDTRALLAKTLEKNVAFMPGEAFYPEAPPASNHIRLNFSLANESQVDKGLRQLRRRLDDFATAQSINHLTVNC